MKLVLSNYSVVFEEPKTLPPHGKHDHTIPLEGVRYSTAQKDVIEKLVDEMLQMGIV